MLLVLMRAAACMPGREWAASKVELSSTSEEVLVQVVFLVVVALTILGGLVPRGGEELAHRHRIHVNIHAAHRSSPSERRMHAVLLLLQVLRVLRRRRRRADGHRSPYFAADDGENAVAADEDAAARRLDVASKMVLGC